MITPEIFAELDAQAKKEVLTQIFAQLPNTNSDIEDISDLLQLDFPYQEATLNSIFANIQGVVLQGVDSHRKQLDAKVQKIHELLMNEANKSALEADEILKNI